METISDMHSNFNYLNSTSHGSAAFQGVMSCRLVHDIDSIPEPNETEPMLLNNCL